MRREGYTFVEILVVMVILTLVSTLAAPVVVGSIASAKESALKENLYVMRTAIDDYYSDHGMYPTFSDELVEKKYIRFIPEDPVFGSKEWDWVFTDELEVSGISDVRSLSHEVSKNGEIYNEW